MSEILNVVITKVIDPLLFFEVWSWIISIVWADSAHFLFYLYWILLMLKYQNVNSQKENTSKYTLMWHIIYFCNIFEHITLMEQDSTILWYICTIYKIYKICEKMNKKRTENIHKTYRKHAENMQKTCRKHAEKHTEKHIILKNKSKTKHMICFENVCKNISICFLNFVLVDF